jgi:hypothetical protein
MFNFFVCSPELAFTHSFFCALTRQDFSIPLFQDLIATFVLYSVRFQDQFLNFLNKGFPFEDALTKSIPFLSEWHIKVLQLAPSVFPTILSKVVDRIKKHWVNAPQFELTEIFSQQLFATLSPEFSVESPNLHHFFAMTSDNQDTFLVSEVDYNLFQWILNGQELPPTFSRNSPSVLKTLRIRPLDTGKPPSHQRPPVADPRIVSEWTVHCMESPHDRMERLREKRDLALVRYGLLKEIREMEDIVADQKELQERVFGVAIFQTNMRCGRELLDRIAWNFGIQFPIGRTKSELKSALVEVEKKIKPLVGEEKLVANGFETYKSGQIKAVLFKEPLSVECPLRLNIDEEGPVALALTIYWGLLSRKDGLAIRGWMYVAEMIQKLFEPSWKDENFIFTHVPSVVLRMFNAADELVRNFHQELGLSKRLIKQFDFLRDNLERFIEKETED